MKYLAPFFLPLLFLLFAPAHGQLPEQTISVSPSPMKISIADGKLYSSSFEYPHISVVNLDNGYAEFITTSTTGVIDIEVVSQKGKIYATMYGSNEVDVYSEDTMALVKKIKLPVSQIAYEASPSDELTMDLLFETGGWAMAHNTELKLIYVSDFHSDIIYVINTQADKIVDEIDVLAHPYEMAIDRVTDTLVVTSTAGNSLSFIKPQFSEDGQFYGHALTKTLKVEEAPWGIEIDSKEHLAYVTNRGSEKITVFSTIEPNLLRTIPIDYTGQAIAIDSKNDVLYVSYQYQNQLVTIDLESGQQKYSVSTESYPWDLHFDAESGKLYAALKDSDEIAIFNVNSQDSQKTYYYTKASTYILGDETTFWTLLWHNDQMIYTLDGEIAIVDFALDQMCPAAEEFCFEATVTGTQNSNIFGANDALEISINQDTQTILRESPDGKKQSFELNVEQFLKEDKTQDDSY